MTNEVQQDFVSSARAPESRSFGYVLFRGANVAVRRISGAISGGRKDALDDDLKLAAYSPRRRPSLYLVSFVAIVVIPSILSIIYLAFIASDQYVSEARFAVQSVQFGSDSEKKGSVSATAIPVMAGQDAYIIADYIRSRAILHDLKGRVDVEKIYQRPEADFWARLKAHPSPEDLTTYWDGMVNAYVDGPSGIITLTVKAFRPDDAVTVAQSIISASEKLANDVSARARMTIMKEAEGEVRRSQDQVGEALNELRSFRDQQGFIDPVSQAKSTATLLLGAMEEKIRLENQYYVALRAMSPNAPTVVELKSKLDGLDVQIEKLKGELTGDTDKRRTIAASLVNFERIELKRVFAEKIYTLSEEALERARIKAQQQNIFVSTFVPPQAPQDAKFPYRLGLSLLIPVGLAILWGIFALIGTAIEDHKY